MISILNPHNELTEFEYDDDSKLIRKLFANGTKEEYSYDERNRLLGIVLKKSNNDVLSSHQYVYDAVSNIVSRTNNGVTTEFTYDLIDQLRTETRNDYEAEYTYDANGNRLTRTVNSVTETYEYDDADKLLNVSINENPVKEYTYDACGRLIAVESSAGVTTLSWDYEDRLVGITYPNQSTNSFGYNPFGARVSKTDSSGSSTYFRAGTSVISPVLSDGNATYTPGISERRNNNSTFYHSDLKNTTTQTNSSETVSGTNQYDAFGNLIDYSGTWNGPFTYGGAFGYQTDNDSGLMLLGHRYYDSSTGRFLSRDPIGDGSNWYIYCKNNPLARADIFGLKDAVIVIGGPEFGDSKEDISADIELGEYYKKKYKNLGYRVMLIEQPNVKIVEHRLKTADVFVFVGHGGKDFLHLPALIPPKFHESGNLEKTALDGVLKARNGKKLELIILEACTDLVKKPEWEFWGNYADTVVGYEGTTWSSARLQYLKEGKVDGRKYPNWKPPKKYNSKKATFTRSVLIAF